MSFLMSCSYGTTSLDMSFVQSGNNRPELEKVLRYYEDDGQKYRAACFLIENMRGKEVFFMRGNGMTGRWCKPIY